MTTNETASTMTLDEALRYVERVFGDSAAEESLLERLAPILLDDGVFRAVITAAWQGGASGELQTALAAHADEMRRLDAAMAPPLGAVEADLGFGPMWIGGPGNK